MSKILIYSDLHCHPHFGSFARVQNAIKAFEWVYQTARDRGITDVVFLGDLFHDRSRIHTYIYHEIYSRLRRYDDEGIGTTFIIGNHDMYRRTSRKINSIAPLVASLKHSRCIDSPTKIEIAGMVFDCMPYCEQTALSMAKNFPENDRSDVLLGHLAVAGAVLNPLYRTRATVNELNPNVTQEIEEIKAGVFRGYKKVLLGHFHAQQRVKTNTDTEIWYVGSVLQINWSAVGSRKYCAILDTTTLDLEWVENTISPKHVIVPFDGDESVLNEDELTDNYVRLIVSNRQSVLDLVNVKHTINEKFGPRSLEIITIDGDRTDTNNELKESVKLLSSNDDDWIRAYVDTAILPEGLDKEIAIEIGMEIVRSARENRNAH